MKNNIVLNFPSPDFNISEFNEALEHLDKKIIESFRISGHLLNEPVSELNKVFNNFIINAQIAQKEIQKLFIIGKTRVQVKFPRSKKKRIQKKWGKNPENFIEIY